MKKYNVTEPTALVTAEQMGIYHDLEGRSDVAYIPGGSGLNTARVAQWISQAPKGSFVTYVGCIADDKYGQILKDSAERDGVNMVLEYTTKAPTGSCAVCISNKERYLVTNLGAAEKISGAHLDTDRVMESLQQAKLFYLTGFTLTIDVEYVLKVARQAHQVGGKFMMNLSAPFIIQFFGAQLNMVLPLVDVLFSNDEEAKAFAKANAWETDDVAEIAKRVASLPHEGSERLVVFTQGSKPTIFAQGPTTGEVPVHPINSSKIVDTNGAGDAFVGGFLAAFARGLSIEKCCKAGNYAAGVIIQHDGCTFPAVPDFEW
jgi:adenosine kinase